MTPAARVNTLLLIVCFLLSGTFVSAQETTIDLFGDELKLWERVDGKAIEQVWQLSEDGVLHLSKPRGRNGSLVTKQEYGDFELTIQWKIAKGVNSGIKYRVRDFGGRMLGLEYQILDSSPKKPDSHQTASLYDLFAPDEVEWDKWSEHQKPAMKWNATRIVVKEDRIEHWLNGTLITKATVGSDAWKDAIAGSKHSQRPTLGSDPQGRIMLTDHKGQIWFRNGRLKLLAPEKAE